jgi:hypothetical protein
MNSFYYTLQSNASKDVFPSNTCTNFKVRLPQRMTLSGQWAVGLAEIHFPIKFEPPGSKRKSDEVATATLDKLLTALPVHKAKSLANNRIVVKNPVKRAIAESPYYKSATLNTAENEIDVDEQSAKHGILSKELTSEIAGLNYEIEVLSDAVTRCSVDNPGDVEKCKVINRLGSDVFVRIKERLVNLEKMPTDAFVTINNRLQKLENALQMANTLEDCISPKYLYIYCDAAELEFIGDKYAPFLRVARVPPAVRLTGETEDKDWVNPHYKKVSRNNFDTLEVDIRCEKGLPISFAEGVVIVTLPFKRVL